MSYTKNLAKAMEETRERLLNEIFTEAYATWGGDKRVDEKIATDIQVPVFAGVRLKQLLKRVNALLGRQDELPLDNVWRVELGENDRVKLTDFTMPSSSAIINKTTTLNDAPQFIRDGLAVLQIASDGSLVDGVGKRISDSVYYILEKVDGDDTRKESERCS
jgi:hypothetical protein